MDSPSKFLMKESEFNMESVECFHLRAGSKNSMQNLQGDVFSTTDSSLGHNTFSPLFFFHDIIFKF